MYPEVVIIGAPGYVDRWGAELIMRVTSVEGRAMCIVGDWETKETFTIEEKYVQVVDDLSS